MKIEVGKTYRLNNGAIHTCEKMTGDDPHNINDFGFGPFVIDRCRYHLDGTFGVGRTPSLDVKEELVEETVEKPDTPKTWGEMTDAEKGALLLANHEGKAIEIKRSDGVWIDLSCPGWAAQMAYRIKPEPVVGEEKLHGLQVPKGEYIFISESRSEDTHTLTLPTLDGKLVCGEFANEDGMKVVIEEKK